MIISYKIRLHILSVFSLLFFCLKVNAQKQIKYSSNINKRITRLQVVMSDSLKGDTLRLYLIRKFVASERTKPEVENEIISIIGKSGIANFNLSDVDAPMYFTLSKENSRNIESGRIPILRQYLIEPGDDVRLHISWDSSYVANKHLVNWLDHGWTPMIVYYDLTKYMLQFKYLFSGKGSAKFQLRADLDKMEDSLYDEQLLDKTGLLRPSKKIAAGIELLKMGKNKVNDFEFELLQADLIGEVEKYRLRQNWTDSLRSQALKVSINTFSEKVISLSRTYPDFIVDYYKVKYPINKKEPSKGAYYQIKNDFVEGLLKDRLLTRYLVDEFMFLQPEILVDAQQSVRNKFYQNQILSLVNSNTKGLPAYNFTLTSAKGSDLSLSDLRGKVVFMDFWYTGCFNCPAYYKKVISKAEEKFKNDTNVVFLSICTDLNWKDWLKSVNSGIYTSTNEERLINLYTDGMGTNHKIINYFNVHSYPRPVLIDKRGRIFSTKDTELRYNGAEGLVSKIEEALKLE